MDHPLEAAWEAELRAELERCLFSQATTSWLMIEDLRFEAAYPDTTISILAREKRRASFLFGFRWAKIWEWVEHHGPETPESLAHVIWANFEEALLELPEDYGADGIFWVN